MVAFQLISNRQQNGIIWNKLQLPAGMLYVVYRYVDLNEILYYSM